MNPKRNPKRQGGYVLLMVVMLLAVLSVVVSALYTDTESRFFSQNQMSFQQVARNRAEFAAQSAIARLRMPNFDDIPINTMAPCDLEPAFQGVPDNYFTAAAAACPSALISPLVDNGPGSLQAGAGMQYRYIIYNRLLPGDQRPIVGVMTIRGVGFVGRTLTSSNLTVSIIDVDIMPQQPSTRGCTGDNYCS